LAGSLTVCRLEALGIDPVDKGEEFRCGESRREKVIEQSLGDGVHPTGSLENSTALAIALAGIGAVVRLAMLTMEDRAGAPEEGCAGRVDEGAEVV